MSKMNDELNIGDCIYFITEDSFGNEVEREGWIYKKIDDDNYMIKIRGEKFTLLQKSRKDLNQIFPDYWEPFEK